MSQSLSWRLRICFFCSSDLRPQSVSKLEMWLSNEDVFSNLFDECKALVSLAASGIWSWSCSVQLSIQSCDGPNNPTVVTQTTLPLCFCWPHFWPVCNCLMLSTLQPCESSLAHINKQPRTTLTVHENRVANGSPPSSPQYWATTQKANICRRFFPPWNVAPRSRQMSYELNGCIDKRLFCFPLHFFKLWERCRSISPRRTRASVYICL